MINNDQYFREKQFKNQIVIHHTASGPNADNVIHGWNFTEMRVGTAYVIDGEGVIKQAFEPEYWAYHLGLRTGSNLSLNKGSIGIEICNWGQLIKKKDKYYNYVNREVPESEVVQLKKFRGFEYFHKYNDLQLATLKKLLQELCVKFAINKRYNSDMWDISANALKGVNGIYTHVSYRSDKADCSPQFNLIETLKSL
jgi:N-acetyl-anhydromuramyl-L-alanine amidase AmpD